MAWHLTSAERSANAKKAAATRKARHEDNYHHKKGTPKSTTVKTTTVKKSKLVTGTKVSRAGKRVSFAKMNAVARLQKYMQ